MLPKPVLAYFAFGGIAGYTCYLAGVELDDGSSSSRISWTRWSKAFNRLPTCQFEGDAAFVYAVAENIDGSLLQDGIEISCHEYLRWLSDVELASTCECKAYVAMGDLDFKFASTWRDPEAEHGRG